MLGYDTPADILIIHLYVQMKLLLNMDFILSYFFLEHTTLKLKLHLWFSLCCQQTAAHEEQAAVCIYTVYCVFILCTVYLYCVLLYAQRHRAHFYLQNVLIYLFITCLCIQLKSSFDHPEHDYGVVCTLKAISRLNVSVKTEMM